MYQEKERMMDSFIKKHPENEIYPKAKLLVKYISEQFENTKDSVKIFFLDQILEDNPNIYYQVDFDPFVLFVYSLYFFNLMGFTVKYVEYGSILIVTQKTI